ncbi:PRC-barrel domain containing protein [Alteromonas sp. ASW11-130]|uniref:PRC-barrel domain containing protein n=1 Tax=Alteromonas sp. ASW11-130 TaxID=3015775 RepID=UPI002242B095|nr:PRC-barrel domain containing protein [Alteromonas sp. ASW11-130]MCW8090271.1 PRC-barrel domain containing protein [Alteromonas sp. ASW11-130]
MLISYNQLTSFAIHATDGDIGGCKDVLFDDQDFVIRYFYADTNTWLPLSRKVVLPPIAILKLDTKEEKIHVNMTRKELKDSPSIDEHKPVSREYEETLFKYFGYGYYWIGPGAWGDFAHPTELANVDLDKTQQDDHPNVVNHLRACSEVHGYELASGEEETGHVEDFLIDPQSWQIQLIVIDTHNWMPGGNKFVIAPAQVAKIDWSSHKVKVKLDKDALLSQPEIDLERLEDEAYIAELMAQVR